MNALDQIVANNNPVPRATAPNVAASAQALAARAAIVALPTDPRRPRSRRRAVVLATCALAAVVAATLGFSGSGRRASADPPTSALGISAFSQLPDASPRLLPNDATAGSLGAMQRRDEEANAARGFAENLGDPLTDQNRVLRSGLGREDYSIEGFPTSGSEVCFGITNRGGTCAPIAQSSAGFWWVVKGVGGAAIYGIARDDVSRIDVQVDGIWLPTSLENNTFFYELPATTNRDVIGAIRSVLTDGTTHVEAVFAPKAG